MTRDEVVALINQATQIKVQLGQSDDVGVILEVSRSEALRKADEIAGSGLLVGFDAEFGIPGVLYISEGPVTK